MWLFFFLCVPAILVTAACTWLLRTRQWPSTIGWVATSIAAANAAFGVSLYLRIRFYPTANNIPPWKDSQVLDTGLLGLLAPIAMILGLIAMGQRRIPWWLVGAIELASIPLFLIGCMAGASV